MTKQELDTLYNLATKLLGERMKELDKEYPEGDYFDEGTTVYDLDCEELYELDDGDNLCQGLDIVLAVVGDMKPTE